MNKKILIINERQNYVLEGKIKKLLEDVGMRAVRFYPFDPSHSRLLDSADLPIRYGFAIVVYSHTENEIRRDVLRRAVYLKTLFRHETLIENLGERKVVSIDLPGSDSYLNAQNFFIEAGTDSFWKIKLLNQLRKAGFEIDEAKFVELAKCV